MEVVAWGQPETVVVAETMLRSQNRALGSQLVKVMDGGSEEAQRAHRVFPHHPQGPRW